MVQFRLIESKKGEIMSGLEWVLVAAVAYWLYNK